MKFLITVLLLATYGVGQVPAKEEKFRGLIDVLRAGKVARVIILRVPDEVLTRVRISQQTLRASPTYSITINDGFRDILVRGLSSTKAVADSNGQAELRWGLILLDSSNKELGSVFLDSTGTQGEIEEDSYKFTPSLRNTFVALIRPAVK